MSCVRFAPRRALGVATWLAVAGLACAVLAPVKPLAAQDAASQGAAPQGQEAPASPAPAAAPKAPQISLQLNKLEPHGQTCRAYMVINNKGDTPYQSFKLDLIEFGTDGIIAHRFAIDLGPMRANKELVKLFDIQTPCDRIGSFLVNDVLECKTASGPAKDCLSDLALSSRAKAQLTK